MKQLAIILALTVSSIYSNSQKIEKYCELVATGKLFSNKVTIDVNLGEERKFFSFKNTQVKDDFGKVKKFNSVVDALNFLGEKGWLLVDAFPISQPNGPKVYHFYFKKEFDISELENTTGE